MTTPFRRALGASAGMAGLAGLTLFAYRTPLALPFPPISKLALAAACALIIGLALAAAPFRAAYGLTPAEQWRRTLELSPRVGLALLPCAPLAFVREPWSFALLAIALGSYACVIGDAGAAGAEPIRSHVASPWSVALLAGVVTLAILYLQIGWRAPGNFQNDSAYYYGVARHIVRSGEFAEPIVWHFLRTPDGMPTAPFDYWGGLTSLALVPALWAFGASHAVANTVMALLSALSVLMLWYLVTHAAPMRSALIQVSVMVTFALTPSLANYRFDTESIPLHHLCVLGSLVAFVQKRFCLAVVLSGLLPFVRGEGMIITAIFWLSIVVTAVRPRQRGWIPIAVAMLTILVVFVGYNVVAFGVHAPTGARSAAFRLRELLDLYTYGLETPSLGSALESRLRGDSFMERVKAAAETSASLLPRGEVWLLAGLAMLVPVRARGMPGGRSFGWLVWLGAFLGGLGIAVASGALFVPWRTLHPQIPLFVLAGGYGVDRLLRWVEGAAPQRKARWLCAAFGGAVWLGVTLEPVTLYGDRAKARLSGAEQDLARLDDTLRGLPAASNLPWYVIANTSSPCVSIPDNGLVAMASVFDRYDVQWLVLVDRYDWLRGSRRIVDDIASGRRKELAGYRFSSVSRAGNVKVYRIERP